MHHRRWAEKGKEQGGTNTEVIEHLSSLGTVVEYFPILLLNLPNSL